MQTITEIGNALADGSALTGALGIVTFLETLVNDMRKLSIAVLGFVVGGMVIWKLAGSRGNGAAALGTLVLGAILVGVLWAMPSLAQEAATEVGTRTGTATNDGFDKLFTNQ